MMFLEQILAEKRREVAAQKVTEPLEVLEAACQNMPPTRSFAAALHRQGGQMRIIAEVKRKSPSKGLIREPFAPGDIAQAYEAAGAAAISVLTDQPFFGGELVFLREVRAVVALPVLRKDFIIDPYQIAQARAYGADAVLLIAAAITPEELRTFQQIAIDYGLETLVEVHSRQELEIAASLNARVIGINNRDLVTFHTTLAVTQLLAPLAPPGCTLVSESGISTAQDLAMLRGYGVDAVLVGESLLRQPDVGAALQALIGGQLA